MFIIDCLSLQWNTLWPHKWTSYSHVLQHGCLQQHTQWKKPDTEEYILCNCVDVKCPEEANPETESSLVNYLEQGGGGWGCGDWSANGQEASFGEDWIILKRDCSNGCTLCKFTKNHSMVHLVNFMVCKLCLPRLLKQKQIVTSEYKQFIIF